MSGLRVSIGHAQTTSSPSSPSQSDSSKPSSVKKSATKLNLFGQALHISCNRSIRDLSKNSLECFGNVYIRRPSGLLTSDYVLLDLNSEQLFAEGNVVYFTKDAVIYGARMDYNFVTETGIIYEGRVEGDKYELMGESIERVSKNRYLAIDGEYTTCRDCPASWRLAARKVDLTIEGYAYLTHVFVKINESPTAYLPWAFVPVKTKRQTGFLFPRTGQSEENGFTFVQPFYWAISRSTDATMALGRYSRKGVKGELEFRYVLTDRSKGELDGFYLHDSKFEEPHQKRWAGHYRHLIELPWKFDQKLTLLDASDRDYARKFEGDIPGKNEPALVSDAGLSRGSRVLSFWADAKRIRNNLTVKKVGFDSNTVQLLPRVHLSSTDQQINRHIPLYVGARADFSRFWRIAPSFDEVYPEDFTVPYDGFFFPGETPIRRAERYRFTPEIYYVARAGDYFEVTPRLEHRFFHYRFDKDIAPPTSRNYLLAQTEVATTFEKIYNSNLKHKIRPSVVYSAIPFINQDRDHSFNRQIKVAGKQFDEFDIVPISNNQIYFTPLGNSLTYRVDQKFIYKSMEDALPSYRKVVGISSGQTINFIELREENPEPLSRFFTFLTVETKRVQSRMEYYYYPYIDAHTISVSSNYIFAKYRRRVLEFTRSVGVSYSRNQVIPQSRTHQISGNIYWSFNDYWAAQTGISYEIPTTVNQQTSPGRIHDLWGGVTYQSPSECFKVMALVRRTLEDPFSVEFKIPINLSGEGFVNVTEGEGIGPQG